MTKTSIAFSVAAAVALGSGLASAAVAAKGASVLIPTADVKWSASCAPRSSARGPRASRSRTWIRT